MLDRQHGIQHDDAPQPDAMDTLAITAYNLLRTGMGGLDWAGLPLVCEYLGVRDLEGLLWRLEAIQHYRAPQEAER